MTTTDIHDPGGKVRTRLPNGMRGSASFAGERNEYRLILHRNWGDPLDPYVLWIGMNPSTADSNVNDPTITREVGFTQQWGYKSYFKTNISAYRATDPRTLKGAKLDYWENRPLIVELAKGAAMTVMAHGRLSGEMLTLANKLTAALRNAGISLWCLGTTANGSPRHPLYLAKSTELVPYEGVGND
jgi:hypothetical protein